MLLFLLRIKESSIFNQDSPMITVQLKISTCAHESGVLPQKSIDTLAFLLVMVKYASWHAILILIDCVLLYPLADIH